jgi:dihydropteroate synthase
MQEQARLLPVLEALRRARPDAILSVDTYHASTARHALDAGAEIINDVSGLLWDEFMASTLAAHPPLPGLVVMHTRGTPQQWHTLARLDPPTVAPLVVSELTERTHFAKQSGIPLENICVDPGFGFGKLGHENYALLAHLRSLQSLRRPILAGLSRKGFLAHALSSTHRGSTRSNTPPPASRRLYATLAANTAAILAGAHIVRVHDIAAALEAASVADSILAAL